ncbi:MAG TPA: ATP-dependent DNA helicase, partial [Thermoanaerobaculia bacterium]
LVRQTIDDCLTEAMDLAGLERVLKGIESGAIRVVARELVEPSPLALEVLSARPYAYLDDAPLEERRAHAVMTRRAGEFSNANDLGALDPAAVERVRDEARPDPRDADELHDALLTAGFLTEVDEELFATLARAKRACVIPSAVEGSPASIREGDPSTALGMTRLYLAAERLPELLAIHPHIETNVTAPPSRQRAWTREQALVELIRGRMTVTGPVTAGELAASLAVAERDVDGALLSLESEGVILRGTFTRKDEWCDRRLLARIHRYTLNRLRAEIEPVGAADFMRFLFAWQHVAPHAKLSGTEGLQRIVAQLDGFEIAAAAWERSVLPARMDRYEPSLLDMLCLTGEVAWARLSPSATTPVSSTPIALFLREHADAWQSLRGESEIVLSEAARNVLDALRARGASFAKELGADESALAELVSAGLIASDGFAGLRALLDKKAKPNLAGRWSLLSSDELRGTEEPRSSVEIQARTLLDRYGIVFRRLLAREPNAAPWRELSRVYRRLEARGEIRGGRFVHGMSGEQFALPDAVEKMREIRRGAPSRELVCISAADPLNLVGIITSDERIRASAGTRIAYRDGVPVSVMEGDMLRPLIELDADSAMLAASALAGRRVPVAAGYVGR